MIVANLGHEFNCKSDADQRRHLFSLCSDLLSKKETTLSVQVDSYASVIFCCQGGSKIAQVVPEPTSSEDIAMLDSGWTFACSTPVDAYCCILHFRKITLNPKP